MRTLQLVSSMLLAVCVIAAASSPGDGRDPSSDAGVKKHMPAVHRVASGTLRAPGGNTYTYSLDLSDPILYEPDDEASLSAAMGGPSVPSNVTSINVDFPCQAAIWDDDGYYNDFTIALHLKDPSNNEITPAPSPAWTSTKPSLSTSHTWTKADPAEGTYTCKADFYVYDTYLGSGQSPKTVSYSCAGDLNRTKAQKEYADYSVDLSPACADFSSSRSASHFAFSELNTGDYPVALIRDPLIVSASADGLEKWRSNYGGPMTVNSAYRNPAHNAGVGGAPQSRHMYGDAADVATGGDHGVWNSMQAAAQNANADFIEPTGGPCGWACVHADWRSHSGGY